jgi:hypothetical protein
MTTKVVDAVCKDLEEKGSARCELYLHKHDGTNHTWQSFWRSSSKAT